MEQERKQWDIQEIENGTVEVPRNDTNLFATIREEVHVALPVGKAMLVSDLFVMCASFNDMKGAKRYNYLRNATKADTSIEFEKYQGRLIIMRKEVMR